MAVATTFYVLTTIAGDQNSTLMLVGAAALCSAVLMRQFVLERASAFPSLPVPPPSEGDRLQALLTNSSDLILVLNPDGTAQYFSPSIKSILGYGGNVFWSRSLLELVHPEDVAGVRSLLTAAKGSVSGAVRGEWRLRDAAGSWLHLEAMVTDRTAERGVGGLLLNIRDVTERKVLERQLRHQALHDPLTGLANRAFLLDRIAKASAHPRLDSRVVALLFLDLDDFKNVNDSLGHDEGDKLLQEIGLRLASRCRTSDLVARLGGDEFAVLIENAASRDEAEEVAGRILRDLRSPYALLRGRLLPSISIGLAYLEPGLTSAELLRRADVAMYAAKLAGKERDQAFRHGHGRAAEAPHAPAERPARRARAGGVEPAIPADHVAGHQTGRRGRGARAMGASGTRPAATRGIPAGGPERGADDAAGGQGTARIVRRSPRLAQRVTRTATSFCPSTFPRSRYARRTWSRRSPPR